MLRQSDHRKRLVRLPEHSNVSNGHSEGTREISLKLSERHLMPQSQKLCKTSKSHETTFRGPCSGHCSHAIVFSLLWQDSRHVRQLPNDVFEADLRWTLTEEKALNKIYKVRNNMEWCSVPRLPKMLVNKWVQYEYWHSSVCESLLEAAYLRLYPKGIFLALSQCGGKESQFHANPPLPPLTLLATRHKMSAKWTNEKKEKGSSVLPPPTQITQSLSILSMLWYSWHQPA